MRRKIVAGNWKMNKTPSEAIDFIKELVPLVKSDDVDVVFCVPYVVLPIAVELVKDTNVKIGAQNMHFEESGAYTGEISPKMLTDLGVDYVIIGHSERREYFNETDETVNKKVLKAFEHNLTPIVCCGESLQQREQGVTIDFVRTQIKIAFQNVTEDQAKKAVIAYEPIWAIGTGKVATSDQAE
ncbi:MAG: triose-phosphate isomerase, partial [Clostridiales bacterium]|nr:triose-phosphate isomerase [Clostridiales bacterium]